MTYINKCNASSVQPKILTSFFALVLSHNTFYHLASDSVKVKLHPHTLTSDYTEDTVTCEKENTIRIGKT